MENPRQWFQHRSYHHSHFADVERLASHKRERDLSLTVILPTLDVANTIGQILETINALNERAPLVDQLAVVDARSSDGTAAIAKAGNAEVYFEDDLLSDSGPPNGKGDAMWRALSIARGDLVMYVDSDTHDFDEHTIYGVLGPLVVEPSVKFVKAGYRRSFRGDTEVHADSGGRVTELAARPLLNLFYPELTGFVQPLAGEFAARRELFCSLPFFTGYAVEAGLLIDVLRKCGLAALAQVDLGSRRNRHQPLRELGPMAYSILWAVARRLIEEGRLQPPSGNPEGLGQLDTYLQAMATPGGFDLQSRNMDLVERPPLSDWLEQRGLRAAGTQSTVRPLARSTEQ